MIIATASFWIEVERLLEALERLVAPKQSPVGVFPPDVATDIKNNLLHLEEWVAEFSLPRSADRIERTRQYIARMPHADNAINYFGDEGLKTELRILREAVQDDVKKTIIFFPSNDRVHSYSQERLFGDSVFEAFPSARADISHAGSCYATDNFTACVFHLMRSVEWGLRAFCVHLGFRRLRQKFKKSGLLSYIPVEYSEWEKILNELQDRIDAKLHKIKRGSLKQQEQEFYYPLLQDIRGIRDAWRNHVMHTRQEYTDKDAAAVLGHVRQLMERLATRIREV